MKVVDIIKGYFNKLSDAVERLISVDNNVHIYYSPITDKLILKDCELKRIFVYDQNLGKAVYYRKVCKF